MKKNCESCGSNFEITDNDKTFLKRIGMPDPTFCPDCRSQRRLSFRNERNLYKRKCDLTGKNIVSMYDSNVPFPVYDHEIWHGDQWDALDYGQEIDFNKPFFDQFAEIYKKVPRINFMNQAGENSDYCNYAYRNKNSYLIFGSHYNEDCHYGNYIWKCKDSIDNLELMQSELVYEAIYSDTCYKCSHIEYCFNCSECDFSYDLVGCKNCLFSSNLRNKEYYIFNEPYTRENYEKFKTEMNRGSFKSMQSLLQKYYEIRNKAIKRNMYQNNCENCLGSDIKNSKNVYYGFNAKYVEDCSYIFTQVTHVKDSLDLNCIGYDDSELLYECVGNSGNHTAFFCNSCWHNNNIFYSEQCFGSKNIFGCIGLKHKEYCILNKQYSKEEYSKLVVKIAAHMRQTGEAGQFFPGHLSEFAYNETVANIHFPLDKDMATAKGYFWKSEDKKQYQKQSFQIPDNIQDTQSDIIEALLACENCKKNYRIIPVEFEFYKKMHLPIPRNCSDCRHISRLNLKNKTALYERNCNKCSKSMFSVYAKDMDENVLCEQCYNLALN